MSVHYKFKSTKDFDTVAFDGLHISVADLKKAIFHQKRIGKNTDFDLQITNAQTKEDYNDDNALIAKNTSLIVSRIPLTTQQKRAWDRTETFPINSTKDEASLGKSVDLTRLDGSEDDKIRAMISQSTSDYDPSNYMKIRGATQTGEVPPNYRCYKCHQPGHWIKNCPLGANQEPLDIKKSTGIPRSFMVPVEGPSVPGAMMTPGGTYAVPAIDHQAYKEGKKEKPPFSQEPEPHVEKPEIREDLVCSLCKDLLTDAVMVPCCGNSFCDECIRTLLLESEDHECPDCNEKDVSPESLIPNRYLRNAVLNFKNETGYVKRQTVGKPPGGAAASELSISERTPAPSNSGEAVPATSQNNSSNKEAASLKSNKLSELGQTSDAIPKSTADGEAAVPPPPGTEPEILPKRPTDPSWNESNEEAKDDEYNKDKYSRERRHSFNRDNYRDRNTSYLSTRVESMRTPNRRRSLSPRNAQHLEYPHHQANHVKPYPSHVHVDTRYAPHQMHYNPNMRSSTDDRAGTPTVDEPHLHSAAMLTYAPPPDPMVNYAQTAAPPPMQTPMMADPYMAAHPPRMPMYPAHPQPMVAYGPPRYDRPYPQAGYRPSQPRYPGPRPNRGMHGRYRMNSSGMRNLHNGVQGIIEDPLEAFNRLLREKDERERRMGKHRRRTRSRSRSRSYSRSRSRSFGRRTSNSKNSRSRSPAGKRRISRSPHKTRSRTPKRRSRSDSFSNSRSRSYSRSPSPRKRDRDHDRPRDSARYKSPPRSPIRYHKDRERDRSRSNREYTSYYPPAPPVETEDYQSVAYRDRPRYPPRVATQPIAYVPPGMMPVPQLVVPTAPPVQPAAVPQINVMGHLPPDRKDYYDSYNRYPPAPAAPPRFTTAPPPPAPLKRFDDVAPPGTEGYYDVPPPGVDPTERPPPRKEHEKDHNVERPYEREDQDRREKDDRDKNERKEERRDSHHKDREIRHTRDERRSYENKDRYKDERDRHADDKRRRSDRDRRERDYEYEKDSDRHRHERYDRVSTDKKRTKRSTSPYQSSSKYRDGKDQTPDRHKKKDKDHDEKSDDRRKEKKIKEKKKKKDSDEKKKKKKKEKKANIQKEVIAAAAAAAASCSSIPVIIKVKQEPTSGDENRLRNGIPKTEPPDSPSLIKIKTEPPDNPVRLHLPPPPAPSAPTTAAAAMVNQNSLLLQARSLPRPSPKLTDVNSEVPLPINPEPVVSTAEVTPQPEKGVPVPNVQSSPSPQVEEDINKEKTPPTPDSPDDSFETTAETEKENAEPSAETSPSSKSEQDSGEKTSTPPNLQEKSSPVPAEIEKEQVDTNPETSTSPKSEERFDGEKTPITPKAPSESPIKDDSEEGEEGEILESENNMDDDDDGKKETCSPKRSDVLAPVPELSKWEREDISDKMDDALEIHATEILDKDDEVKSTTKVVTTEVLKRAENAIFQKAINAIRPIEIKKISDSRKVLYQNPEPKVIETGSDNENRKNVSVIVNIGKNERNVELTSEMMKKSKIERSKLKSSISPTRLSVKDRLGEKVDEETKIGGIKSLLASRVELKNNTSSKRSRSPRLIKDRQVSLAIDDEPIITNTERKVFVETSDRKRDRTDRSRSDLSHRKGDDTIRIIDRTENRKVERTIRTPPLLPHKSRKDEHEDKEDRRKEKKSLREDKKRKKDYRSRSKSKERKKRKDRKHKREKERERLEKAHKRSKEKEVKEKLDEKNEPKPAENIDETIIDVETYKKQRRNPRLVSDRKRSMIDEANFEPDYSESDSESDDDDKATLAATKRAKLVDNTVIIESDVKPTKKRPKPSSSEDEESSSSESSSTESDSSVEVHRKKKKKHKKRKKRKVSRKETSSDSDVYSDSSESSSEEEKHRKKKKSKSKNKQSKKKKKSKHK